jgi:hypothetical protein
MLRVQAELAADMEREGAQAAFNIEEIDAGHEADMERIRLEASLQPRGNA